MKQPLDLQMDNRGVCRVTLNRPQCGNALDGSLVQQLSAALATLGEDTQARALVLTGHGKVFCSGADLQWMQQMAEADISINETDAFELALLLEQLAQLPIPTLARVNGPAFGGAAGLICACDIAVASDSACFTFSEVRLGLIPAVIAPYVIAAMGLRQARRWFLSAEKMDCAQALQLGLVHQRVSTDALDKAVKRQLELLLQGGAQAQAQLKRMFGEWLAASPFAKEDAAELLAQLRASAEGQEGLAAFLQKRKPGWLK